MIQFTKLERAVLEKLLDGDHPLLAMLRYQLSTCRVTGREWTGVGFFTDIQVDSNPEKKSDKIRLSDVVAEIAGMQYGAGFVLYIDEGKLCMLEGYGFDEPWPLNITDFKLSYMSGEKRDWIALRQILG